MSDSDRTTEERIANLPLLGRDKTGAVHRLDATGRVVYVLYDGELARSESIRNRGLSTWVQFVADRRGWADLYYDERPTGEWLADAVMPA